MKTSIIHLSLYAILFSLVGFNARAGEDEGWPREISTQKAAIVIYQPQPLSFEGNQLSYMAAVSVTLKGKSEPVFGAVWATARVETDREARTVKILDIKITNVRFPEITDEQAQELAALLETEVIKWELEINLDRVLVSLAAIEKQNAAAKNLKNDPPKIIFSPELAVLVLIDGEPELRKIENSKMMQVINSPYPIILETSSNTYYLSGGEIWYKAGNPKGPWQYIQQPPKEIAALVPKEEDTRASAGESEESSKIPKIVVATEPTELLVSDGDPKYSPISNTDLLFMSNSESDILLEIPTQNYFVLISGRWFSSASLDGPWSYVAADKLPKSFAKIPFESANGHLLAFVGGTEQAAESVMDNQMPQTSTINRKDASLEVTYDGAPKFEKVGDTGMEYAVNTGSSVLKIQNRYYCCEEAVWYESDSPTGPWTVSTSVPDEVQEIPPENPNYNVKYVYIYDSTPEVVYVGYTPAYMGSYVYGPCVVYGTGYYYHPWYGPVHYYPRPYTWGFHVRYNPWYGWSFGISYSSGPFRMTIGFGGGYHRGYYGPGRYRPYPYRSYRKTNITVNRNININTGDINIGNKNKPANRDRNRNNIYNRQENRKRNVERPKSRDKPRPSVSKDKRNNVYTDRSGNVHRKTDKGWEKREAGKWSPPQADKSGRPSQGDLKKTRPSGSKPQPQLERDYRARQRGNDRARRAQGSRGGRRR